MRGAKWLLGLAVAGFATAAQPVVAQTGPAQAGAQGVFRAAFNSALRSIDPVWTTAVETRYHAFMVYDTLFGFDDQQRIQPQMVERYTLSPDQLTYEFMLRDGLRFSDGAAVTADDVVASWNRWMERDSAGIITAGFLAGLDVVDAKTFRARLKEPFASLLYVLGKPMAMPMFVMPARIARGTPGTEQIKDATGSGPFVMKMDEWVVGSKVVYVPNPHYLPRAEPASGIAGGKQVHFARVEWINIPDPTTAVAALQRGEVDFVEQPPLDVVPSLKRMPGLVVEPLWGGGTEAVLRVNWTNPPFDNQAMRRALHHFVSQPDMLMAVLGDPALGQVCGAMLICGTENGSEGGADDLLSKDPMGVRMQRGMAAMRAAGYKNEPIIIMDPPDQPIMHGATQVLADTMRRAGVNVDLQTMDWATLVTRRTVKGPGANGWHLFATVGGPLGPANPAFNIHTSGGCDKAFFGWPCDTEMERLRAAWVRETDRARARALAEQIQVRGLETTVYLPIGQYLTPSAWRANLDGLLRVPETVVFWNVRRKS